LKKTLDLLAKICAILGGLVVVAITLVTTGSIVGRWLFNAPLPGDTEVTEYGMALIVASFLPICQWRRANIIVDFFTARMSPQGQQRLDRIGALLIALMMAMIAWRTAAGALDQKSSGSVTMLLQWPEWIAYAMMVPPLALTAVIAVYMAITGGGGRSSGEF
jgi:TRAP-type C4-dicarboxylate transport system permease small subunit